MTTKSSQGGPPSVKKPANPAPKGLIPPAKIRAQALALGKLVGNLQSLELILRRVLYARRAKPYKAFKKRQSMSTLRVGEEVPINAYTSYATLGDLVKQYNKIATRRAWPSVDKSVVDLRDALAM